MAVYENLSLHLHSLLLKFQSSTSFVSFTTIIALCVFFSLLCACIIIGHLLHGNRWANESISALLLGLLSGGVVLLVSKGHSSRLLSFSEDLFFLYLLPPIIFNAGFQVKKKQFFKNITIILLFGVLGTVISFCLISLGVFYLFKKLGVTNLGVQDYLALGAILSATDSVCTLQVLSQEETPFLYSVVFGEGVVNDATSIVLFNAVQSLDFRKISGITALELIGTFLYLFSTSTLLGVAAGLLSAYIIKTLYFGRHSTDREVAIMLLMAYFSYMLAELLDLSGIMTIFFCGIVMSHYTWHNVTESSRITTKHAFATLSFVAENFIFLYLGMDALDVAKWKSTGASIMTSVSVSATLLALVLFGRAAFIFPLTNIRNFLNRKSTDKIEFRQQFIMWWAGLMRGAVTIALSYSEFAKTRTTSTEDSALTFTCIIIIVLFTTTVFGLLTKPLIEAVLLRYPRRAVSDATDIPSLEDLGLLFLENADTSHDNEESNNQRRRSSLHLLIKYPTSSIHYLWRKFDDRFMRPVFGGRGFAPYTPGSPTEAADESHENH